MLAFTSGALIATGVAAGALMSHLTLLGIEVQGDGGLLFALALTVFSCSLALLYIHREQILALRSFLQ